MIPRCPKCKGYVFSTSEHACPPLWEVFVPYPDPVYDPTPTPSAEDIQTVYSQGDQEDAALDFAAANWSNWENPSEKEIWARTPGGEWRKFVVTCEMTPMFTAERKDEKDATT